jgi:hypothetical protein
MGCLNGEGVIGKHLMGREKIALPSWQLRLMKRERKDRGKKQIEFNEKKKKKKTCRRR